MAGSRGAAAMGALACVLIALLIAIAPCPVRATTTLSVEEIYGDEQSARTCLNHIWRVAAKRLGSNYDAIANCLRMAFHDAGTYSTATDDGGANGSIMYELSSPANGGLGICGALIPTITAEVRSKDCCQQASVADIIQVTGAVAVYLAGGPACSLLLGRPDSNCADPDTLEPPFRLPSPCDDASTLLTTFTRMGFNNVSASLVVLSGAHAIGKSRGGMPSYCTNGQGAMTSSPKSFDNHYYQQLTGPVAENSDLPSPGFFKSDNQLYIQGGDVNMATQVYQYATNNVAFLAAWCPHYKEMGLLGVDPSPYDLTSGWLPASLPSRHSFTYHRA